MARRRYKAPEGYMTVHDLAVRWALSEATIQWRIRKGTLFAESMNLHPTKDDAHPVYVIPIDEVNAQEAAGNVTRRIYRSLEVRAFQLFAEGKNAAEAVMILRVPLSCVDKLYDDYCNSNLDMRRMLNAAEIANTKLGVYRHLERTRGRPRTQLEKGSGKRRYDDDGRPR